MTRMIVAIEGANVNNCVILPGALHMEDAFVPVTWHGDNNTILGKASKMERNGNEVSVEIELKPDVYLDLEDQINGYVYVSPFESKQHELIPGAICEVGKGRIRAVCLQDLGR